MNQNSSKALYHPILGFFEPIEDLLYYDCPYVFTFRDAEDRLAIAYLMEMENGRSRYLAVPISTEELEGLKSGIRPLRSLFTAWAWDIVVDENANIVSVCERLINELNQTDLPPAEFRL